MDLEECKRKGFIRLTKKNNELAKSLIEVSDIKETAIKNAELNEVNISAYVPMAYDSLRETLEAICIMNGYKVTSHVCVDKLLNSIYKDFSFNDFDRFRYIRNSINYYGEKVGFKEGKDIIDKIFLLRKRYLKILGELL